MPIFQKVVPIVNNEQVSDANPMPVTGSLSLDVAAGDRVAAFCAIDGSDKYTVVMLLAHLATNAMELVVEV